MGLDTSHGAWHGAYSAFMFWRKEIARVAGLPPLELMEGFYQPITSPIFPTLYRGMTSERDWPATLKSLNDRLPIKWDCLISSPLHILLSHSDCDGEIAWQECKGIAEELDKLLPLLPVVDQPGHIGNWKDKTKTFIDGLLLAYEKQENLDFH